MQKSMGLRTERGGDPEMMSVCELRLAREREKDRVGAF